MRGVTYRLLNKKGIGKLHAMFGKVSSRLLVATCVVSFCGLLSGQALYQKPVKVLGDPNYTGTASSPLAVDSVGPNWVDGQSLSNPSGVAVDSAGNLYIADTGNNRVLGYRAATQAVSGASADLVIGQPTNDFSANQPQNPANGGKSTGLNGPTGIAVDATGNLYVADTGNNRILRYPAPFANAAQFPSLVVGQKSFSTSTANLNGLSASSLALGSGRTGIAIDPSGNLWVADTLNNRVLRFPAASLSANFPAADIVLGQASFTAAAGPTDRTDKTTLGHPNGIGFDTTGNLYVTDQLFRVLWYNAPVAANQIAARVLGVDQTPPAPGTAASNTTQIALDKPLGVAVAPGGIVVADTGNNRIMEYALPMLWPGEITQFSPSAALQVGQTTFNDNKANQGKVDSSASTFSAPVDMAVTQSEIYVVDSGNNRVLVFLSTPSGIGGAATRVIGQVDFPYNGVNLVDGKGFSMVTGFPAQAILDSASPSRLFVADTLNNRVLIYNDFVHMKRGQLADMVLGQPDQYRNGVNYPTGDPITPNATGLNEPTALTFDSAGNLYVADTGNSRIVRFPAPFTVGETADLVLGQPNLTTNVTDPTAITMNTPLGLAFTSDPAHGYLVAVDGAQNRVLLFQAPFTSGMAAAKVIGQSTFNSSAAGSDAAHFVSPRGVAVDPQDRIIVADTGNNRVQIFDKASTISNLPSPLISLTANLAGPDSVAVGPSGDFWVANSAAATSNAVHYPSISNLPLTNNAADAAVPVYAPHSVFVDRFSNLLVTDGVNRALYFAPQLAITNAASFQKQALSAGTIVSLFPSVTTNSIANGTDNAPGGRFPLPTTIDDTQAIINGTPIPLLYVSPSQINAILPNALPAGGVTDLQVIRPSTGQVYGGSEISLTSSSPGLFTLDQSGAGGITAINFDDNTINGPNHAVRRGSYLILYGTGIGPVANEPADGMPASGQPASDLPTVLVASSGSGATQTFLPATVTYSGLAPGFAGLWQINVQIPANAQSGSAVTIRVFENGIPNLDPASALTTTIAVD